MSVWVPRSGLADSTGFHFLSGGVAERMPGKPTLWLSVPTGDRSMKGVSSAGMMTTGIALSTEGDNGDSVVNGG
jgi:hypothetical protein